MFSIPATRKGRFGALFCLLLASATAQAQTADQRSWDEMRRAALAAPDSMGQAIARKMLEDWQAFLAFLAKQPRDEAFFEVVLRSINPTLDTADLKELDALAHKSCPDAYRARCNAIAKEAAAALKDAR
jgi:hypothetical protein